MRGTFARVTTELIDTDERVVALLGDIGVFAFRHAKEAHPDRVYDRGVDPRGGVGRPAGRLAEGYRPRSSLQSRRSQSPMSATSSMHTEWGMP